MTLRGGGYNGETRRIRAGLVVLLVGVVLLLGAMVFALIRTPEPTGDRVGRRGRVETADQEHVVPARLGVALMVVGMVLVVTLLVAGYVLLRLTRRYALGNNAKTPQPTPSDDVWQMNRAPPDTPAEPEIRS